MFCSSDRVLVVAAHPDDEILGCGGTLALARSLNLSISVMFLGEGISARFPIGEYDNNEFHNQASIRKTSAINALKFLDIFDVDFGNRLCTQFDTLPMLSIVKDIESKISSFNPTHILTHNLSEVNIDHRITYQAVEVACRPTRQSVPSNILSFEIPCSGSWTFSTTFKPNIFVDVEKFWDKKIEAWNYYAGECHPFPFPRSVEGLKALAQYRGMMSNLKLAEAFHLERAIYK